MFVPIGDSPNFRSTPWITYTLIAVNILVYLWLWPTQSRPAERDDPAARAYRQVISAERGVVVPRVSAYDAAVFRHGFKPGAPNGINILTAMFLHGGFLHLFGNMLFLWIYGDNVEHRLGAFGFLIAYLATGYAAALGDALLRPDSLIPSVGASGAISGVLGFYFIWFPRNRVRVWVFLFPIFMNVIEFPARVVLGIYLVVDNILPALFTGGQGGVAYGAHLGGFASAVLAALLIDQIRLRRPESDLRSQQRPAPGPNRAAEAFLSDVQEHDLAGALNTLMDMNPRTFRRDLAADDILRFGAALEENGHPRAALSVYQRLSAEQLDARVRALARIRSARVLLDGLDMPVEAYQQLVRALESSPPPEIALEARALLERLAQRTGSVPAKWRG